MLHFDAHNSLVFWLILHRLFVLFSKYIRILKSSPLKHLLIIHIEDAFVDLRYCLPTFGSPLTVQFRSARLHMVTKDLHFFREMWVIFALKLIQYGNWGLLILIKISLQVWYIHLYCTLSPLRGGRVLAHGAFRVFRPPNYAFHLL